MCKVSNSVVLGEYYFAQEQRNIHVYVECTDEYYDCIDCLEVLPRDIFIDKCKEFLIDDLR